MSLLILENIHLSSDYLPRVATVCAPLKQEADLVNCNAGTASARQIYGRDVEADDIQFCFQSLHLSA